MTYGDLGYMFIVVLLLTNIYLLVKKNTAARQAPRIIPKEPPPLYRFKKKTPAYLKLCDRHIGYRSTEFKKMVLLDNECDACAYLAKQKEAKRESLGI